MAFDFTGSRLAYCCRPHTSKPSHEIRGPTLPGAAAGAVDTHGLSEYTDLESLAKRILTFLELVDLLLSIVADALDVRERPLAGQRRRG